MPVILEHIKNLTADDRNDLIKLYRDYPPLLADESQIDEFQDNDPQHWINKQLNDGLLLFAGRFNGRLLCAVWAKSSTSSWQLMYLCVRSATRRRGVARQLLTLLIQYANTLDIALTVNDHDAPAELKPLLTELGFTDSKNNAQAECTNWIKAASTK